YQYINAYGSILGGTENLLKIGYDFSLFETFRTFTIAFRFLGGSVVPYPPSEIVPYSERFLLGGEGSLRGVKRYSVGDYDIRGIKSGTNFYLINFEIRKFLTDYLKFVIFFDTGTCSNIFSYKSFKNNAFGFGIGFRYFFGILPFRVDFGTNNYFHKTKEFFFYLGLGHYF
ncbi:MAG: BamA/TamA family outer membrane protein, partial [Candidatus Hydrothermales bacterium]